MKQSITVILNGFRRPENISKQFEAIINQSVKPEEILLFYNNPMDDKISINQDIINITKASVCNTNFGVWARFAYALNARTKYVCVFDDDTIPGSRWLENCVETIKTHRGLLGTNGLICRDKNDYFNHERHGWINPNEETVRVDIVGHAWFFERDFLSAMWCELPPIDYSHICGEDMHFSYTLQKYKGLYTYVPPHPKSDKSLWGSLDGWDLGTDEQAISLIHTKPEKDMTFRNEVDKYFKKLLSKGWSLING